MGKPKIEEYKLVEYLQRNPYGPHPKTEIADHFGCGLAAVDGAISRLRKNSMPAIGTPEGILLWKQGTRDPGIVVIMLDAQAHLAITARATQKQAGVIQKILAGDVPAKTMKQVEFMREASA
jgi:hypothetical protein